MLAPMHNIWKKKEEIIKEMAILKRKKVESGYCVCLQ